jgi:hypothetical protein
MIESRERITGSTITVDADDKEVGKRETEALYRGKVYADVEFGLVPRLFDLEKFQKLDISFAIGDGSRFTVTVNRKEIGPSR